MGVRTVEAMSSDSEHLAGMVDPGGVRDGPAQQPVTGDAHREAVRDPPGDVAPQPTGDAPAGRELGGLVDERLARAGPPPAGPLRLVPTHQQRLLAVGQVPRSRRPALPNAGREHPTRRTGALRRIIGQHMHHPGAAALGAAHHLALRPTLGVPFNDTDLDSAQPEQDRHTPTRGPSTVGSNPPPALRGHGPRPGTINTTARSCRSPSTS